MAVIIPPTDRLITSSQLILSDDGTDQTLTGTLGGIYIKPAGYAVGIKPTTNDGFGSCYFVVFGDSATSQGVVMSVYGNTPGASTYTSLLHDGTVGIIRSGSGDLALNPASSVVRPYGDNTFDFGTSSYRWKNGYFSGTLNTYDAIITNSLYVQSNSSSAVVFETGGAISYTIFRFDTTNGYFYTYDTTGSNYLQIYNDGVRSRLHSSNRLAIDVDGSEITINKFTRFVGGNRIYIEGSAGINYRLELYNSNLNSEIYSPNTNIKIYAGSGRYIYIGDNNIVMPYSDNTCDLGKSDKRWKNGYFSGIVNISGQPACRAYLASTSQTIPTGTWTVVNLDGESFDTQNMHDNVTNNSRITIPTGGDGKYLIHAHAYFTGSTGGGNRGIRIRKNGTTYLAVTYMGSVGTEMATPSVQTIANLSAGDYVEMEVYQTSGSDLNIYGWGYDYLTFLEVHKLS